MNTRLSFAFRWIVLVVSITGSWAVGGVKLGIDTLAGDNFKLLEGKRVGLVGNPASVDSNLRLTVDVLRAAKNVKLTTLYAPEHGIYGDIYAGVEFKDKSDARTGLPVYSVYGETRTPTAKMLKGIDALVFDMQDIGSRSYTFVSSMKACMHACAEHDLDFVVLDRPNPLGGERIEGPALKKEFESFIGYVYVPYVHGMTMGELAQFVQATELPKFKKLHVVKMSGWKRSMLWADTGLTWVPTSPNIPHAGTCAYYAATGFLGELGQLSHGIGYTMPFETTAAPWIDADGLADALNLHWDAPALEYGPRARKLERLAPERSVFPRVSPSPGTPGEGWGEGLPRYDLMKTALRGWNLPEVKPKGVFFRPMHYEPFYAAFNGEPCHGVQVLLDDRKAENLVEINMKILEALGAPDLFAKAKRSQIRSFDITAGSDETRKYLMEQRDLRPLFEKWKRECEDFRGKRRKFLLYE